MSSFASMTVAALRAECVKRSLEDGGRKAELVQRLTDAEAASAPSASSASSPSSGAAAVPAYDSMSVAELKALLSARGLASGRTKKDALVKALQADDAKADGSAAMDTAEPAAAEEPKKGRGKRKAAAVAPAPEEEEEAEETKPKKGKKGAAAAPAAAAPAAASAAPKKKAAHHKVDPACRLAGASVYEDYDAVLNQVNIGANNNKFYRIQVIVAGGLYYCWTHWGRVGEDGQNQTQACGGDVQAAIDAFNKKFADKTGNGKVKWEDRANLVAKSGKYTLLEMDNTADEEEEARFAERLAAYNSGQKPGAAAAAAAAAAASSAAAQKFKPSKLRPELQELMALLFDPGTFTQTMASYEINTAEMPLGKLSKTQIQKGFDILTELEAALKPGGQRNKISELSSRFYTLIPHSFGRRVPPPIASAEMLQTKQDLLNVLSDIEVAQDLQAQSKKKEEAAAAIDEDSLPPSPFDAQYDSLKCNVELLQRSDPLYAVIEQYVAATRANYPSKMRIREIFRIDRHDESKRFAAHAHLRNRRLCWHGTSVAVVAAILNSGLRIMPHSGGRVGKGIYLADQHGKSAAYVRPTTFKGKQAAIMFLAEAALGDEHTITRDDSSLRAPPAGKHSVVARGSTGPDPKHDVHITLDGLQVAVPQSKPVPQPSYAGSSFDKSEFLLYSESQHRIRFMLLFDWSY